MARLTELEVRNLPAPPKGQKLYRDDALPGFGCRVSQGGTRTFVLVHGADRQFLTLGRYPIITLSEARTEAKRFLAEKTLGKMRPKSLTYAQARELFLAEKKKSKRASTVHDLHYYLDRFFKFKGYVGEVTHDHILKRLDKIKSPSMYNHALASARGFFNWCHKRRYISENPVTGLSPHRTVSRARVLSDAELKLIYRACDNSDAELPEHFRTIVKLLILTGQRRGEVAALEASYYDAGKHTITLPGALTKNHKEHTFPVATLAVSVLPDPAGMKGLLFPARGRSTPFNGWSKSKAELDRVSAVADWTLHDLRRTFATRLAEMGDVPVNVEIGRQALLTLSL